MSQDENNTKISDWEYFKLAGRSYEQIYIEGDNQVKRSFIRIPVNGKQHVYKIIKILDNKDNGAQGFAVAPVDSEGKADTSRIIIAYRGTEGIFNGNDVSIDVQQVVEAQKKYTKIEKMEYLPDGTQVPVYKEVDSQFISGLKFADEIKKKYPDAQISATGHSLGAGIAQYVAVERGFKAVTYAAPNVYRLLSQKGKEAVKSGKTKELIVDYTHMNDTVGNFSEFGAPIIGSQYFVKEKSESAWSFLSYAGPLGDLRGLYHTVIGGHFLGTFQGSFNKDGVRSASCESRRHTETGRTIEAGCRQTG